MPGGEAESCHGQAPTVRMETPAEREGEEMMWADLPQCAVKLRVSNFSTGENTVQLRKTKDQL